MSSKIYQDRPIVKAAPAKGAVSATTNAPAPAITRFPVNEQVKLGNKCCGCCCDFRHAVIICNVILLVFAIIGFILVLSGQTVDTESSLDDDSAYDYYLIVETLTLVSSIMVHICSIVGAAKYNACIVLFSAIWYVLEFIVTVANLCVLQCLG